MSAPRIYCWARRGPALGRDPGRAQKLTEGDRVQRVAIEEEDAFGLEKAVVCIEEIPRREAGG
jgi:hypothetical protein